MSAKPVRIRKRLYFNLLTVHKLLDCKILFKQTTIKLAPFTNIFTFQIKFNSFGKFFSHYVQ